MDLSTLTDEQLDALRVEVLTEQERRQRLAQLPDQLATMARDAVEAGCDPETIRERVNNALTPEDAAALDAVPTEPEPAAAAQLDYLDEDGTQHG